MDILQAITERRSIRAFLDKPLSKEVITEILNVAKWAPSGVNTQPWQVTVLGKKAIQKISDEICQAREASIPENPDYIYYPKKWTEPFKSRRKACGIALYDALGITLKDIEKRKEIWYRNYSFFGAPYGLIFHLPKIFEKGAWLDLGMFMQNVMLTSRAFGLETCPQASLAEYPDIIRRNANISYEMNIVCGMAIGYPDWSKPINQYRNTRAEIDSFTKWVD